MDKTTDILESDLLKLIQEHVDSESGDEPNTITSGELAEAMPGLSQKRAGLALKELAEEGKLQPAMVWRENDWGHRRRVMGFRYAPD